MATYIISVAAKDFNHYLFLKCGNLAKLYIYTAITQINQNLRL